MAKLTINLIQDFILHSKQPTSFAQIQDYLVKNETDVNKTTIYRNLERLEKELIIKKVLLSDQKQFWEKATIDTNHYHLVCETCNKVECVDLQNPLVISKEGFKTRKLELNLIGVCSDCQKK